MKSQQSKVPEAIASASYSLQSPKGFPLIFTVRHSEANELISELQKLEQLLQDQGYQPDIKKSYGGAKKAQEIVPNRKCPKCGSDLVYFTAKGQKHIKCFTQKYYGGAVHGCNYVEWSDRQTPLVGDNTGDPTSQPNFTPASQAQIELIKNKWPDQYQEGLSKAEASQIISARMEK